MRFIADNNIPFLAGRLEDAGVEMEYIDQHAFTQEKVRDADALLIRTRTMVRPPMLDGSRVRMVATGTIGTDHIDLPYAENEGVKVRNSPGCNAPGVAQYVWASLLRLGFDPARHTLGVVGKGNVGRIVVEWGRRLGARVLVCDPPRARRGEADEEYLPLEDVLREADAVTFHTPLTRSGEDATFHLLDADGLALMKPDAILVNAARGPVVDNAALKAHILSLRKKAGELPADRGFRTVIDTWEGEPAIDRELLDLVDYGTFHIAGYSRQGKERATRMVLESVAGEFGLNVDLTGLAGPYSEPEGLSARRIVESYDPAADTAALRESPDDFDRLRDSYDYREETE